MDPKRALRWAGIYVALAGVAALIGLALVGAGVVVGGATLAYELYLRGNSLRGVLLATGPGIVLQLLGIAVWAIGRTAARYGTFAAALEAEGVTEVDSESLKSNILSVVDDRLSDLHEEVSQTRRLVNRMSRDEAADEFEF